MTFDIEADVTFPLDDDERLPKLLIGTVLTLFSVFLIPLLPVYGYLMRTARVGMTDAESLPEFTDWESLFVEGIKALVIVLLYQVPPLVVAVVSVGGLLALGSGNDTLGLIGILVFVVGMLLAAVLWIVFGYLGIVGVLTFAQERELGAAFDVETIRSVALDTDFFVNWLYGLALVIGLNFLVGIVLFFVQLIALIPIIGWIIAFLALFLVGPLSAAVSFYGQLVAFRVWGRSYADSRGFASAGIDGSDEGPEETSTETPTSETSAERMSGVNVDDDSTPTS